MDDDADIEASDFVASTNAQIIHILRNAADVMDAHAIYAAGAFSYEAQVLNALATLSKKGVIERDKPGKVFLYRLGPDAEIPDYLRDELQALEAKGLPAPPPRHVGLSRAEYEGQAQVKRERKEKRTVTHTTTIEEERSVTETVASAEPPVTLVEPIIAEPAPPALPSPEPPVLTAPAVAESELSERETLRALLEEQRDDLSADLAAMRLIELMASAHDTNLLAWFMGDWREIIEGGGVAENEPEWAIKVETTCEYEQTLAAANSLPRIFARVAYQLRKWAEINEMSCEGCHDKEAEQARRDVEECRKLAAMFDIKADP